MPTAEGRCIVTLAGGPRYFPNAYGVVRLLRELGCYLPVYWCYIGDEMTPWMLEFANEIAGVTCIDLAPGAHGSQYRAQGAWQHKVNAVLAAPLREVLFLDADCFPMYDPTYVFDHPQYRDAGVVLWPDGKPWGETRAKNINEIFGVPVTPTMHQVESGQMLFDKGRSQPALRVAAVYNRHSDEVYKWVYGDKDTFLFGCLQAKQPHVFTRAYTPGTDGVRQHDLDGQVLFYHLTGRKWLMSGVSQLTDPNFYYIKTVSDFIASMYHRAVVTYGNNVWTQ